MLLHSPLLSLHLIEKRCREKTTNHKRYDPVVCWETSELFTDLHFESRSFAVKISMPKAYSEDLRLRAVWLHFFLGYGTNTVRREVFEKIRT